MSFSAASYSTTTTNPSFNLFIPSASPRDTHTMYEELGFVFRQSNKQNMNNDILYGSTAKSIKSTTSSTKSSSSLKRWLRRI